MRKLLYILLVVIILCLSSCSSPEDPKPAKNVDLGIAIEYKENVSFNQYSIDVFLDNALLFSMEQSEFNQIRKPVTVGPHTIEVVEKDNNKNIDKFEFNVTDNAFYIFSTKAKWGGIKITDNTKLSEAEYIEKCGELKANENKSSLNLSSKISQNLSNYSEIRDENMAVSENTEIGQEGATFSFNDNVIEAHGLTFTFLSISLYKELLPGGFLYFAKLDYIVENKSDIDREFFLRDTGNLLGNFYANELTLNIGKNSIYKNENYNTDFCDGIMVEANQSKGPYYVQFVISDMELKTPLLISDYMKFDIHIQDEAENEDVVTLTINDSIQE